MLALLAALLFFVAIFERAVFDGRLDLVVAGFVFVALHLALPLPLRLPGRPVA